MKKISIFNKLKKELNISLGSVTDKKTDYYVHSIDIMGTTLLVIVKPESYYSYTAIIEVKSVIEFDRVLSILVGTQNLLYTIEKNQSEISRISTIGKKYSQLINMKTDNAGEPIILEELEKVVNNIPWKFLGFKSPAELESKITHNRDREPLK